jgi:Ribose/xylose/arabinose/galactoside ABC-type transport systems, permease components
MFKKLSHLMMKGDLLSILAPVIIFAALLSVTTQGFLSAFNLQSLGRIVGITTIVGLAQLAALSIGHFNLALGSMASFAGVFTSALMEVYGVNLWIAIAVGIFIGAALGYIQGLLIVKTGINPFIITLSLTSIYLGFTIGVTRGILYQKLPETFKLIGKANLFGIPLLFYISIVVAVVLYILMHKTVMGRQLLATGANPRAANVSGIEVNKITILAHTMSGVLAGIAGILQVSRMGVGQTSIGADWMLISFAAPVLGGTIMSGGKVNVIGTIFGAMLMGIITNALVLLNISQYWFQTFMGLILLGAFELDRVRVSLMSAQRMHES